MAFKKTDPILGATRGSADICYAHAKRVGASRLAEVKKYIDEIYRLGPLTGIDAYVLYTQAVHESGDFQSSWWRDRLNPAGIGITGDVAQGNASKTWTSGTDAARAHVAHMLMYTLGKIDRGGLTKSDDPRYSAYIEAHGADGIADTVADLQNTWGIDNGYAAAMERRGNEIWSAVPNAGSTSPNPIPSTQYATPEKIDGFDGSQSVVINGITFHAQRTTVKTNAETPIRQFAATASKETRAAAKTGEKITVLGWVKNENGELWWITTDHSRFNSATTIEKPVDEHPTTIDCPVLFKKNGIRITSQHGEPNGAPCEWYDYATDVGLDYCDHPGADLGVNFIPCYAVANGTIEFAGPDQYYSPNHVNLRVTEAGPFKDNVIIYGHLSKVNVTKGQTVKIGDLIGTTGQMDAASGPHLHFEVRTKNEIAIDPLPLARRTAPTTGEETPTVPTDTYTPNIIDRWLHVSQLGYSAVERRYKGRYGMTPKIIVVHIQEGYNLGSWQWFHETTASSTVMIATNGDIWRLVPEADAPWTNGDVNVPSAKGREIINKWGADPNVFTLSIENEGFNYERNTTSQWSANKARLDKQVKSNIWQIKQWMSKYRIDLVYVIKHEDISTVGKPDCPGDAFYNALIAELKANNIPTTPAEPVYAEVSKLEGFDGSKDVVINGLTIHAEKREVTASAQAFFRQFGGALSSSTQAPVEKGKTFKVLGWLEGEAINGEPRWWISENHSRVSVTQTTEKPGDQVTVPSTPEEPVDQPNDERVVKFGITHYPAHEPNTNDPRKIKVELQGGGWKRVLPATTAAKAGKANTGDELTALYWCWGETVRGDRIWWLLDNGTDDPFTNPQYIWSQINDDERPD